jgi:hypothetical protein
MNTRALLLATALQAAGTAALAAQTPTCTFRGAVEALAERPSPLDSVSIPLGGDEAKLCYGRPSARGRTMLGGEDPFGSAWRLGANEPTTLHLPYPATVGDVELQPGSYSLYAIPEDGPWTIVVNSNTNRWGIPINPEVRSSDIGSFRVTPSRTSSYVETLTFRFEGEARSGALVFAWEHTTFRIPVARR